MAKANSFPSIFPAEEFPMAVNFAPRFSLTKDFLRHKHRCIIIFKCFNLLNDFYFKLSTNNSIHSRNTRTSRNLHLHKTNLPSLK